MAGKTLLLSTIYRIKNLLLICIRTYYLKLSTYFRTIQAFINRTNYYCSCLEQGLHKPERVMGDKRR